MPLARTVYRTLRELALSYSTAYFNLRRGHPATLSFGQSEALRPAELKTTDQPVWSVFLFIT